MRKSIKFLLCLFALGLSFTLMSCNKEEDGQTNVEGEKTESHEHDFSKWVVEKEATCTEDGKKVRSCECGETEEKTIKATGHDIVINPGQPADCYNDGWKDYEYCTKCDYTTYVVVPAGHVLTHYEAQEPTCTMPGWEAFDECFMCGYSTFKQIEPSHKIITHEAQEATCSEVGWHAYEECENCDYSTYEEIPTLEHSLIMFPGLDATCLQGGWEPYEECRNCDYSTYCELEALGHDIIAVVGQAATCQEIGWEDYECCSRCDYTTYQEIPTTGHVVNDWSCENCDMYIGVDSEFGNYSFYENNGVIESNNKGRHSSTASLTFIMGCDATISFYYYVSSESGYDYLYIQYNGVTEVSKSGYYDYTYYEKVVSKGDRITFKYSKDSSSNSGNDVARIKDFVIDCVITEASCEEDGQRIVYDLFKDDLVNEYVEALGHDIVSYEAADATCEEAGHFAYEACSRCDYTTYEESEPALGHNIISVEAKDPTCTEEGHFAYEYCDRCDYTTYFGIAMTEHIYGEWEVYTEATCTEYAVAVKSCVDCGNEEFDYYWDSPLGHTYGEWVVTTEPTCTESGERVKVCSVCEYEYEEYLSSLGHEYVVETLEATCTTDGYTTHTCSVCEYSYTDNYYYAYGHWIVSYGPQEATCEVGGHDGYEKCLNQGCDYTTLEETTPALGHDLIYVEGEYPTCTSSGYYDYEYCSRCYYNTQEYVSNLGHDFQDWETIEEATCTTPAYIRSSCSRCDEYMDDYDSSRPALGHTYGDEYIVGGTNLVQGYKYKECSVCEYVYKYDFTETDITRLFAFDTYGDGYQVTDIYADESYTTLEIPSEYNGKPVLSIATRSNWGPTFEDCEFITTLIIPETVVHIGYEALSPLYGSLEELVMPVNAISRLAYLFNEEDYYTYDNSYFTPNLKKLTLTGEGEIGYEYFKNRNTEYNGLETVILGEGITSLAAKSFMTCDDLKYLILPESLVEINKDALTDCTSLIYNGSYHGLYLGNEANPYLWLMGVNDPNCTSYEMHEDTKHIGPNAFKNTCVTTLDLPSSLISIGDGAFGGCVELTEVVIPESVTTIYDGAFSGCTSLRKAELNSNVTTPGSLFAGCTSLTEVIIPEGVTCLGRGLFMNCSSLTEIYIPRSVTELRDAFDGCNNLVNVYYAGTFEEWLNIDYTHATHWMGMGMSDANPMYSAENLYVTNEAGEYELVTEIVVEEGVEELTEFQFYGLSCVKRVVLPQSLEVIHEDAFLYCNGIEELVMPFMPNVNIESIFEGVETLILTGDVTEIPAEQFDYLSSLKKVELPETVTTIGYRAFYGCSSLEEIVLPEGLTHIDTNAFAGCSALKSINFPSTLTVINESVFASTGLEEVILPNTITEIKTNAFGYCIQLDKLYIPNELTNIANGAFQKCTSLSYITMPVIGDRFAYIFGYGQNQFYYSSHCPGIMEVVTVYGTDIPNSYFDGIKINKIVLGEELQTIGNYIIESYTTPGIYYLGSEEAWANVEISSYNSEFFRCPVYYYTDGCIHEKDTTYWTYDENGIPTTAASVLEWTTTLEPTCSTPGIKSGNCTSCGEIIEEELAILSHVFENNACSGCGLELLTITTGSYTFVDDGSGLLISNNYRKNKTTASYKITANAKVTISYDYKSSSEKNYDYLHIFEKGSLVDSRTGDMSYYYSRTVTLNAGETLEFQYKKDEGTHSYNDRGYVKIISITPVYN